MLQPLLSLKGLVKPKAHHIDYPVFRLHYQVSVCLILGFCLILSTKVLFGDPIDCRSRGAGVSDLYDNICYSLGTYTTYQIDSDEVEADNIQNVNEPFRLINRMLNISNINYKPKAKYLSSGLILPIEHKEETYEEKYWHLYYNYIPILLFLQGVLFYFPHYLWKTWENGAISSICKQLHETRFTSNDYTDSIQYLKSCFALNRHRILVCKYYICELLLIFNLLLQIIVLDSIFNHQFITYGSDMLYYWYVDKDIYGLRSIDNGLEVNNPMDFVFPKITICSIKMISEGGLEADGKEFICSLPLNILHDKFYLILWFWMVILAIVTVAQIIFDALYIVMPMLRRYVFKCRYGSYLGHETWQSSSLAELFVLDLIGSNSDRVAFSAFLKKLNKEDWKANGQSVTV